MSSRAWQRGGVWAALAGVVWAATACSSGCVGPEEAVRAEVAPAAPLNPDSAPVPEAPPVVVEPPLGKLKGAEPCWYDLVGLSHFAERGREGSLLADLGGVSGRKFIHGGWRAGWSPTPRAADGVDYFEANQESARVTFSHTAGGFDRIAARMKAVKSSNSASVSLNGVSLGKVKLGAEWETFTWEVPAGAARAGENELVLKFAAGTRVDGRAQVAHVDAVAALAPGKTWEALPSGLVETRRVGLGGAERSALIARQPQSMTWRVQLPAKGAKLGLAVGSMASGARLRITAQVDGEAPEEVVMAEPAAGGWREVVAELGAWDGQVVELVATVDGAVDADRWVAWEAGIYAPRPVDSAQEPKAPEVPAKNVLVYLIDTLRRDKLGVYNAASSVATPNLDAFARDALIFDGAYDAENWTKPSTASILTGLYPWNHKTKDGDAKLPESVEMVSEHLRKQGVKTGSFIANGYVSNAFGFDQGWNYYTNYIRENKITDAEKLVDDALRWVDRQEADGRWFAYVHTIDPHVPYSAPGPWKFKMWEQRGRGKYHGDLRPQSTGDQIAEIKSGKMKMSEDDRVYLESLYDSEVAYNDHEFGRLIQGLKDRGVYDDTVIVVLVDHGEEFWDHGSVGHGHSVYDEMVHSPLFIRYPNRVPTGRRVPQVVSTTAVVPTVLALMDVPAMADRDGEVLVDVFDGVGEGRPRIGVSDFMYRKKGIRVGRYRWLTTGEGGELYDIEADPKEKADLAATHPIGRAFVRGHFGMFMGAGDQGRWWEGAHREVKRLQSEERATVDPELAEQLEAMGYVEGATSEQTAEEDKKLMEQEDKRR